MMDYNSNSTQSALQELVKEFRELCKSQEVFEKQSEDMKDHLKQTNDQTVRFWLENQG